MINLLGVFCAALVGTAFGAWMNERRHAKWFKANLATVEHASRVLPLFRRLEAMVAADEQRQHAETRGLDLLLKEIADEDAQAAKAMKAGNVYRLPTKGTDKPPSAS